MEEVMGRGWAEGVARWEGWSQGGSWPGRQRSGCQPEGP